MELSPLSGPKETGELSLQELLIQQLTIDTSTGYGYHADYVFGWKGDSLQRAVDQRCGLNQCDGLTTQQQSVGNKCTKAQSVKDDLQACKCTAPRLHQRVY